MGLETLKEKKKVCVGEGTAWGELTLEAAGSSSAGWAKPHASHHAVSAPGEERRREKEEGPEGGENRFENSGGGRREPWRGFTSMAALDSRWPATADERLNARGSGYRGGTPAAGGCRAATISGVQEPCKGGGVVRNEEGVGGG